MFLNPGYILIVSDKNITAEFFIFLVMLKKLHMNFLKSRIS